jgi:hypothetical protein
MAKLPRGLLKKLGISTTKRSKPAELKAKAILKAPKKLTPIKELEKKLGNAMTDETRKKLKADIAKLKKPTTKTLVKEQKKQSNLNTNQKTGLKTNKVVKGDETKDALKTAPLTEKELKDRGIASGASEFRLSMASLKGKAKALATQVAKKKEQLAKLSSSDRAGEKGMLLKNAIADMQKKLKGQAPISTLRNAGLMNKGGMVKSKATTYKGGVLNGHGKDYGKPGGYNMGGLAAPTAKQTGLKKLPSSVRNKMGYMYGGGMAKKKTMGSTDYRKGGLVIMIGTGKPMKTKKGN